MISDELRDHMNAKASSDDVDPSYVEALITVIERNELNDRFVTRDTEYLRGQLELIADCWAIRGLYTDERIEQIEQDLRTIIRSMD